MDRKASNVNRSKVRLMLKELRKRKCENFRVVGQSVYQAVKERGHESQIPDPARA